MIGHKVQYHLHACGLGPGDQSLELLHTAGFPGSQIRIDIVVIRYCKRGTGASFYSVITLDGMTYDTRVPYMGHIELPDPVQHGSGDVLELTGTVLFLSSSRDIGLAHIAEHSRQHLIYYEFAFHQSSGLSQLRIL